MSVVLNNNDLRSEAKAYQRDKNHNAKWARGFNVAPGKKCNHPGHWDGVCDECAARPLHRDRDRRSWGDAIMFRQTAASRSNRQAASMARKAFLNEVTEATDGPLPRLCDNSSDSDEVYDASTGPIHDAEIMYSYDATSAPGRGSDILSHAVTQAVRRFENNETEKLVHREYDVIDDNKEGYTADEEDGFELIDHSHLN